MLHGAFDDPIPLGCIVAKSDMDSRMAISGLSAFPELQLMETCIGDLSVAEVWNAASLESCTRLLLGLCLRGKHESDSKTETFAPVLRLVLSALLYGELHLRPVHQAFLQVLSERMAHFNKGFVEVGKSMCSGFRRRHLCRTHANGHAYRTLHDRGGPL